ncbi:Pantothenate kinase [Ochrobactrum soli]|uniref:Pantothenate kinase n=1 Tax=Ochrobactrum soli TaxID=2448455 RepID=A0A2P9HRC0_9HYPH|nr:Pantothenate kinase [[Ochrobactrum] soli]
MGFPLPEIAEADVRHEVEFDERLVAPIDHGDGELCRRHDIALVATGSGGEFLEHDAARETAFRDPQSFVHRYLQLSEDVPRSIAEGQRRNINLHNLNENILPTHPPI